MSWILSYTSILPSTRPLDEFTGFFGIPQSLMLPYYTSSIQYIYNTIYRSWLLPSAGWNKKKVTLSRGSAKLCCRRAGFHTSSLGTMFLAAKRSNRSTFGATAMFLNFPITVEQRTDSHQLPQRFADTTNSKVSKNYLFLGLKWNCIGLTHFIN